MGGFLKLLLCACEPLSNAGEVIMGRKQLWAASLFKLMLRRRQLRKRGRPQLEEVFWSRYFCGSLDVQKLFVLGPVLVTRANADRR